MAPRRYEIWRDQLDQMLSKLTGNSISVELQSLFPSLLDPTVHRSDWNERYEISREEVLRGAHVTFERLEARLDLQKCFSTLQSLIDGALERKRRYEQAIASNEEPLPYDHPYRQDKMSAEEISACYLGDKLQARLDTIEELTRQTELRKQSIEQERLALEAEISRYEARYFEIVDTSAKV